MNVSQIKNKGMTLIELMIVIAILGVISAIAIPAYKGYVKTAKIQECQQGLASLALAQEEYFLEQRTYFTGASIAALETASNGLWAYTQPTADRNCAYQAALVGTTGYTMTVTGTNQLTATDFTKVITK